MKDSITFPKKEHNSILNRLKKTTTLYTTRISQDYGRYHSGDIVKSDVGPTFKVEEVHNIDNVSKHPFYDELTKNQIGILSKYNKINVLKLSKVGNDLSNLYSMNTTKLRSLLGNRAQYVGSTGMRTSTTDSDIDIFIPENSEAEFNKRITKLQKLLPGFTRKDKSEDKTIFQGKIEDNHIDIAVGYGPKSEKYISGWNKINTNLSDNKRAEIVATKKKLNNAWFLKDYRYNKYKKQLHKDLGLVDIRY